MILPKLKSNIKIGKMGKIKKNGKFLKEGYEKECFDIENYCCE